MPLITDSMVQAAFDYLNGAADAAAKARADKILKEHLRKKIFAEQMLAAPHKTGDMRKAWAEASDAHWQACEEEGRAIHADAWHQHQKARAMAILDSWRTEQSNLRSAGRVAS